MIYNVINIPRAKGEAFSPSQSQALAKKGSLGSLTHESTPDLHRRAGEDIYYGSLASIQSHLTPVQRSQFEP